MIQNIFPIAIGTYELDRNLSKTELSFLKGSQSNDDLVEPTYRINKGNLGSVAHDILHNEKMAEFTKFIGDSIEEYCKETYAWDMNKAQLYVTQSWTNLTKPGGYHHKHSQQNSLISGVFYFEGNDDDKIIFYRDIGVPTWKFNMIDSNDYNTNTWWMPATAGTLYLFPSKLEHSVPKVEGTQNRYSLSFNTFIRGEIGEASQLSQLFL
jgi:uncharacterized protein (TIGR02466 family)